MSHTGMYNDIWAQEIVDQLYKLGVHYFCISPGSRSTPLAIALERHPLAETFVHLDERGLGFHALGHAKASNRPVAVVVTSGTAVGNLLPSLMEASHGFVPLLFLTADRPPELRDCGANQTVDQVKVFASFVRWQVDLPCPGPQLPTGYLASTLSQALYRAMRSPTGPVHINCMFREPLFSAEAVPAGLVETCRYEHTCNVPTAPCLERWAAELASIDKGLILAGSMPVSSDPSPIVELADRLGWPICADITSRVRGQGKRPVLRYFDTIIKSLPEVEFQAVLHLGDRFVSKALIERLAKQKAMPYFLVAGHPLRYDPKHNITNRMECDPVLFAQAILPYLSTKSYDWINEWEQMASAAEAEIELFFEDRLKLSEPGIARMLHELLPPDWHLFISNSMPVRDMDALFFPINRAGAAFANRGVSGIDGNIATTLGIASASKKPVMAILGDQAFLHDMNSLISIKKVNTPVLFIIINNGGGGIFSFLPIAKNIERFEEFFAASHALRFDELSRFFQLPYYAPEHIVDFRDLLLELTERPQTCLIEITTERNENVMLHEELQKNIQRKLCSLTPYRA